jgi:hypothetical protein
MDTMNSAEAILDKQKVFEIIFSLIEQEKDVQKLVEKISVLVDGLYNSGLISPSVVNIAKSFAKNELPIYLKTKELFSEKGFDLKIVSKQKEKNYTPEEIAKIADSRIERVRTSIISEAIEKASSASTAEISETLRKRL